MTTEEPKYCGRPYYLGFQPFYQDQQNLNTNSPSYYNYLGKWNKQQKAMIDAINRNLARNIKVEDTQSINLEKIGDWHGDRDWSDIITLKADVTLSKFVGNENVDSAGVSTPITNALSVKSDGLFVADHSAKINKLDEVAESHNNRLDHLDHVTEATFFPIATKTEAWGGTNNESVMTPLRTHEAISVFNQKSNGTGITKFAAHRGATTAFPENSSLAIRYASRFDYAEFDIQLTSDKKWVVMHDRSIDRTTNGSGNVDELTVKEVQSVLIDTGVNVGTMQNYEKIVPTLTEALDYCNLAKVRPMIEIKAIEGDYQITYTDEELKELAKILNDYNQLYNGVIIQSFRYEDLVKMREYAPECICVWNVYHLTDEVFEKCKQNFISPHVQYTSTSLSEDRVLQYHNYGLIVCAWTVPYSDHDRLIRMGVDIITTSSAAGSQRVNDLSPAAGASHMVYTNSGKTNSVQMRGAFTEQLSAHTYSLNGGLNLTGTWTQGTRLASFAEEVIPYLSSSMMCMVKYSDGTYGNAWIDIIGYVEGSPTKPAGIYIGANWENKNANWVRFNGTYTKI